ncbi:NAD kinase [Liberibacter crescens BT-1]|uniref:NAD kinase n=1 Tax=Liberibacter crescens (strain BT-1) TaxID=1215343 RepID=L0ERG1_LIBCB|nr:NAD kinase [Liberibacter crescens]AGA64064.1 NAD kinase [Liberibacter crescens BT-1]AMC12359.1 inorganic polyphosphate kinase [Liberibacter crescens]
MTVHKIHFTSSPVLEAQKAYHELVCMYTNTPFEEADVIVALGGDGFMLQTLHGNMKSGKPVYGMNRGSVGFLMNDYRPEELVERLSDAVEHIFHPLKMTTLKEDNSTSVALAVNEASILRQSFQAAKLKVMIDGKVRLDELICDGLLVSTPVGSTAYNLSAHGPILPLEAPLLALTPVSPFRPRRWRGALISNHLTVDIEILEPDKRPVNAVADHTEVKSALHVQISQATDIMVRILSNPDRSWSDRILTEQFST